jgi:hypothetical protein
MAGMSGSGFSTAKDLVEQALDIAKVAWVNFLVVLEVVAEYR